MMYAAIEWLRVSLTNAGLLRRLQQSAQPITDGRDHLVVLCETIEAIFRKGLKREPPTNNQLFML